MLNGWKSYVGFALWAAATIAAEIKPEWASFLKPVADAALGLGGIGIAHKLAKATPAAKETA